MKRTLGAVAAAMLLTTAAGAQDQQAPRVLEVRVEGNRYVSDRVIRGMLKTRPGDRYSAQVVKDDQQRLLGSGRFESVIIRRRDTADGVILTVVVDERASVRSVAILGNKHFKNQELRNQITVDAGDAKNPFAIEAGRQAILSYYHQKGFPNASVTIDERLLAEENRLVYRIVEGPRVRVDKIRFEGNESFGRFQLGTKVGQNARFWPFLSGNLNSEQVEQDVAALRNFYISEGFLDAEVGRTLRFTPAGDEVVLTFVIREGPRFRVNELVFEGNEVYADEELAGRLKLERGEWLQSLILQRDIERIEDAYGELGFLNARAESRKRYLSPQAAPPAWAAELDDGQPALVDLVFTVREGEQYRIGEINIKGNTVTQSRVIRRELRFFPTQWYNTVAVDRSRRELMQTQLFDAVDIRPVDRNETTKDVEVQVTEGMTARFIIGAGVSTASGLLGNISVVERNFDLLDWPRSFQDFIRGEAWKGAGQRLAITAEPGTELNRFSIDWREPYLFDLPYSLGGRAFIFERERDSYDESRYGGMVSLGHRFANGWYGELAQRIENVELEDFDPDIAPEIQADGPSATLLGSKVTLVRDRTDSRWQPSRGDRFRVSYEQVFGDYNFSSIYSDYRIFRTLWLDPLDRKHILGARMAIGYIFGDAPVYERYYAGGLGSVRGFDYRGISPRSRANDDAIGGDFLAYVGTEYTFPLVGENLRGAIFLDSGTVEREFEVVTWRVATGFGLRWTIDFFGPVPMTLDFGFPIVEDEEDEDRIFNFSIGWEY